MSRYVGVDGCSAGWLAVTYDPDVDRLSWEVHAAFAGVVDGAGPRSRLLVDMPIGLPESGRRACDAAARERLGSRASTVFFAPCRAVLDAADHETASALNREKSGYGLSIQAWHLVPRIRDVDATLRNAPDSGPDVSEAHPELCFAALAGEPVTEPKSTEAGRERRLSLLDGRLPGARDTYRRCLADTYRKDVARDDIVDALGLSLAASGPLDRVPAVPDDEVPRDGVGLPMEIRYPTTSRFER